MDSLSFELPGGDPKPTTNGQFFCLFVSIGFSIILIILTIKQGNKVKGFFSVGVINFCISLACLYNVWEESSSLYIHNEQLVRLESCVCFFIIAATLLSSKANEKPFFKILAHVAIFLATESTVSSFTVTIGTAAEEVLGANIAGCFAIASLLLCSAANAYAEGKSLGTKVSLYSMCFLAATYAIVYTIYMILDFVNYSMPERHEIFRFYYLFIVNAILPGSAILLFRIAETPEESKPKVGMLSSDAPNSISQ